MEYTLDSWYSNIKKNNLGLNKHVQKKFNDVDTVDNISQICFKDPEVEHICHEHGVYTIGDAIKVTSIKDWFNNNYKIKSFDEFKYFTGLKEIEKMAFCECKFLQSINIPDSVTSIEDEAFSFCTSLQSITIPDSVTSIGVHAFMYCKFLQSVTIPNSVTSIGDYAFDECKALQSVTIPNGVTSIGNGAFCCCEALQSIKIPNSVTSIGKKVFARCKSLQSVAIPNSVTSIGVHAFMYCKLLKAVYISKKCPVYNQIKKAYPDIQLIEPKVIETCESKKANALEWFMTLQENTKLSLADKVKKL